MFLGLAARSLDDLITDLRSQAVAKLGLQLTLPDAAHHARHGLMSQAKKAVCALLAHLAGIP
jgi:hypothetical protein